MKKLIIVIILIGSLSCSKTKDNNKVVTNATQSIKVVQSNIDSFDEKNKPFLKKEKEGKLTYDPAGEIKEDLNKDGKEDLFKTYNYTGWEGADPGDFRKIEIETHEKFELKNIAAWVRLSNMNLNKSLLSYKSENNDYYVTLDLGFNNPVIICFGYWYADTPGYISIFSVDEEKPQLVFNKPFHVREVRKVKGSNYYKLIGVYKEHSYELVIKNKILEFNKL